MQEFDVIKWSSYTTGELFEFLEQERISYLKKRLRGEIFHRLSGSMIRDEMILSIEDDAMKDILYGAQLLGRAAKHRGLDIFTKVIAPLNYIIGKLQYDNLSSEKVDDEVLNDIKGKLKRILKQYERSGDILVGAEDTEYLKERLKGVVVIIDGLRYDTWRCIKDVLIDEGWKVTDRPFKINAPSTTLNFRNVMGIDDKGHINGKRYILMKYAEREAGRRGLKGLLKGDEDIKFLHYNFIDVRAHGSTLDLYPLNVTIKSEFISGILPVLKGMTSFHIISDHGFTDTGRLKNRYTHGGESIWETILPFVEVSI